jgi:hypothetical protein
VNDHHLRRGLAVTGLVTSAVLLFASVALQPDLTGSGTQVLARVDAAGWRAGVSAAGFALAQLPYIAAVLGITHLLRRGAPRLATWGGALSVVGAFGHAVFGGISLVYVVMSHDEAHRAAYGHLVDLLGTSPVMIFSLLGLAGFVVGLLLLSIGLFRAGVGPRWTGPAVWVFLVVEFVGTALSPSASYLSSAVLLAVFAALTRQAWTSWDSEPERVLELEPAQA